jgi:phosphate transport system permease protein
VTAVALRDLRRPRLARSRALAAVAVGVALTAVLFAVTPMQGRADFVVVAYLLAAACYLVAAARTEGRRGAVDRLMGLLVVTAVAVCLLGLVSVLAYTAARGAKALSVSFFTHSMNGVGPRDTNGGAYHAILGTVEQVLLAAAISVPTGLTVGVYLTEYGRGRFASVVRGFIDVMVGIPSVVAGLFIYAFWVLALHQGFSGLAGALALSLIMLPIVVRSAEEMIKLVPSTLREASYALGIPRWRTVVSVILPTASAGIATGVMLAVARVAGETAPLLLTTFGFDSINPNPFKGAQSSLPLFVFTQAGSPFNPAVDRAWAGALVLIVVVLILTAVARAVAGRKRPRARGTS